MSINYDILDFSPINIKLITLNDHKQKMYIVIHLTPYKWL